jgi:hypothetical protein
MAQYTTQNGETALLHATIFGHADCVRLLIDAGADKDAKDMVRAGRRSTVPMAFYHVSTFICSHRAH